MRGGYVRLSATSVLACKKMFFQESCNIAKDLSFCRFSLGGGSYAFGEQKKKKWCATIKLRAFFTSLSLGVCVFVARGRL